MLHFPSTSQLLYVHLCIGLSHNIWYKKDYVEFKGLLILFQGTVFQHVLIFHYSNLLVDHSHFLRDLAFTKERDVNYIMRSRAEVSV